MNFSLGCGSGRDSIHFKKKGYSVTSIEFSKKLIKLAKTNLNLDVIYMDMRDLDFVNYFNAIWSCASMLHIDKNSIKNVLDRCYIALKDRGVFYLSFKYGVGESVINDRFFNYYNEIDFEKLIALTNFKINKIWLTQDVRVDRVGDIWLNSILEK
ncbi:class I SAM-dependent methyltransferase [bacterium]|nr:class I SAM-dependent methyltransferase [bacterium]